MIVWRITGKIVRTVTQMRTIISALIWSGLTGEPV